MIDKDWNGSSAHRLYTRDPSLRNKAYGKIEPLDYGEERQSWPFAIAIAMVILVVLFAQFGGNP